MSYYEGQWMEGLYHGIGELYIYDKDLIASETPGNSKE